MILLEFDTTQIYVDEIIFGSTNIKFLKEFIILMENKFKMSLVGELTFFLGLQIKQRKERNYVYQNKYACLISKSGMGCMIGILRILIKVNA